MKHRAVITFGIHDQPRVLFRGKEFFFADMSVASNQLAVFAPQFDELIDHLSLARLRPAGDGGEAILLRIFAKMIEASVTITRPARRERIHFVKVAKNGLDRRMHTVEIQAVDAGK